MTPHDQVFSKVRQNRMFEDVIQQVEDAIVRGNLKPGDRLPAERELQKMLDVSRGTLRESLRVLEQKGLIEIKTGAKGGIFVKDANAEQMSDSLAFFVRSQQVSLGHLAQFREDVEGLVAARAAVQASADDVNELKRLLDQAASGLEAGVSAWSDFMATDMRIHLALATIAGNPLHRFFLETVHDNIHKYNIDSYLPRETATLQAVYEDLHELVEAVGRGDAESAQKIARGHVSRFNKYMEQAARQAVPSGKPRRRPSAARPSSPRPSGKTARRRRAENETRSGKNAHADSERT